MADRQPRRTRHRRSTSRAAWCSLLPPVRELALIAQPLERPRRRVHVCAPADAEAPQLLRRPLEVMDELVELERVDLAGVVTLEALSHMFEQPRELGLVIGADGSASRSPFRLRRTGLRACPAVGIAGRYRLRTLLGDWRAGGHDGTDLSGRTATIPLDGQSHEKASHEPLDG